MTLRMGVGRDSDKRLVVNEIEAEKRFVATFENKETGEVLGFEIKKDKVKVLRMRGNDIVSIHKSMREGKEVTWDELCELCRE